MSTYNNKKKYIDFFFLFGGGGSGRRGVYVQSFQAHNIAPKTLRTLISNTRYNLHD